MIQKICSIVSTILIVIMLLFAGVLLVPYVFGYQPTTILTGSMEPIYPVGSVIFVKKVAPEEIKVRDVIAYSTSGMGYPITHRVISIDETKRVFVTQGDANDHPDGEIAFSRLSGRATTFSIPLIGYVSRAIQSTMMGKVVAGGVVLLIILLAFLPDLLKPKQKNIGGNES